MQSKWIRCPKCGHKLFKYEGERTKLEIKCSSCKAIVEIRINENTSFVKAKEEV